jgi:hypothetical protein
MAVSRSDVPQISNSSPTHSVETWSDSKIPALLFMSAFAQFAFFTYLTLNQPILDMWGFRPAQTAASVPYMLHEGAWFANVVPIFGKPWVLALEFPLYQWCVALLVKISALPLDASGRLVSAFFALATMWPAFLLGKSLGLGRRFVLILGALWLFAPLIIFWGRTFLIETTIVFLSACWLAYYVRFLKSASYWNLVAAIVFGIFSAAVKITGFLPFVVIGFIYTCFFIWVRRAHISALLFNLVLAALAVGVSVIAFRLWGKFGDSFLVENPLASHLRSQNIMGHYLGTLADRMGTELWDWAVRRRVLPETLGAAWFVGLYGLVRIGPFNRWFWAALTLIVGFLSAFVFFPKLHTIHAYYQVENALFIVAAIALIVEALLRKERKFEAFAILAAIMVGQLYSFYGGFYYEALRSDLRQHPYYLAGKLLQDRTQSDSVVVGFGMGYGADVPYYSNRRGVILGNWFSTAAIREVLFDDPDRWLGGRKIAAVVDCRVFRAQAIADGLKPLRDELVRDLAGKRTRVTGSVYGATTSPQQCDVYLSGN